jgi:2,3-bisphosphoglycerate-independent phosphoglycerate mutase
MSSVSRRPRPVVLVVIDGLGACADIPVLARIEQRYPHAVLSASGPDLGLSPDQTLSSEGCHMALGLGRAPTINKARIDAAVRDDTLATNPAIRATINRAKDLGGRLHLVGLVSDGGVHSSLAHLFALVGVAKRARVRVVVHAVLDGRDVPSGTAPQYVSDLEKTLDGGVGRIGTVSGRFWAMDRDERWDRIGKCYRAVLAADVYRADSALRGIEESYATGKTDDLVEPFVAFDYPGVSPVDTAIHFNFRADGARELTRALAAPRFEAFPRKGGRGPFTGCFACMTTIEPSLDLPTAFPAVCQANTLPEIIAHAGFRQFRCAETEIGTHVCSFFSAGRDEPFEGEDRKLVPSLRDIWMAPAGVAQTAAEAIRGGKYDFVLVNFADPKAVGYGEGRAALDRTREAIDAGLRAIADATRAVEGALVVTGPPGVQTTGTIPVIYVHDTGSAAQIREGGSLRDVAPTLLELLGLPAPIQMTGRSLLVR